MRKGVLEFDGDAESAIGLHHQFLTLDSAEDQMGHRGMPVTIVGRTVCRDGVEVAQAKQEDTLEVTWTVEFNQPVHSPQATFRIMAEDGTLAYSIHTTFGTEWREFAVGERTEVTARFQPRFGGGGTFRLMLDVSDKNGVQILGSDTEGPRLYVDPRLATMGNGDALATVEIAGQVLSDWPSLSF